MSSELDAERRYDEFRQFWEGGSYDDWNFDVVNEGDDDWNIWNQPPAVADQLWHDTAPTYFEPYASSSTLEENSPPRPARDRTPRLRLRSRSPSYLSSAIHQPMGNTSSSTHTGTSNHNLRPSPARNFNQTTTSSQSRQPAAYDLASSSHRRSSNPPDLFGYVPEAFNFEPFDNGNTPSDSFDGIDIDDILNSDEDEDEEDMPSLTRRQQRSQGVVDLTNDSSPPRSQPRSLKRPAAAAAESASQPHPSKRSRRAETDSSAPTPKIEELDLTNEAPSAEEELRQAQQQAAIKAQQAADRSDGPLRIGKRQCIICMEKYTDATITHCGHIYCHECLTQALQVGEKNSDKGVGNCPVCRKTVSRKRGNQMIVVNFMKKSAFHGKGRRQDVGSFG